MLKKIYEFFGKNTLNIIVFILSALLFGGIFAYLKDEGKLDLKGGIQNHLVWSIKGECYFVKPKSEATSSVYLIRVEDCDKK